MRSAHRRRSWPRVQVQHVSEDPGTACTSREHFRDHGADMGQCWSREQRRAHSHAKRLSAFSRSSALNGRRGTTCIADCPFAMSPRAKAFAMAVLSIATSWRTDRPVSGDAVRMINDDPDQPRCVDSISASGRPSVSAASVIVRDRWSIGIDVESGMPMRNSRTSGPDRV